jgi:serine/threonine-protein kinase HipA
MDELVVLLEGREAGRVVRKGDRLSFTYAETWRGAPDAYPLSLSMPLAARTHGHREIDAFIWGLLPDNERTLSRWAREFQVSARNGFALIGAVGEDCAGAVQFVSPERLDRIAHEGMITWIDNVEIGRRLRSVLADADSGRTAADNGQFSLAGAQPKTALLRFEGQWGLPSGRIPTTHILKPPSPRLPGHAENEHFCLSLAAELGIRAASSTVEIFDGQPAICVERYDRVPLGVQAGAPEIARVHQEDMCQALAVRPEKKYQNEGGPTAADIVRLIRDSVGEPMRAGSRLDGGIVEDMWTFIDGLVMNWLIGGTDAHAKNYSFLIGAGGLVRLAPLYDLASAYGFDDIAPQRMKLAMKIGSQYHVERIMLHHWRDWAPSAGVNRDALVERIRALAARLPGALARVAARLAAEELENDIVARLRERLTRRAEFVCRM